MKEIIGWIIFHLFWVIIIVAGLIKEMRGN